MIDNKRTIFGYRLLNYLVIFMLIFCVLMSIEHNIFSYLFSPIKPRTRVPCNYPKLNPFDPAIMHLVEDPGSYNCIGNTLFSTDLESNIIADKEGWLPKHNRTGIKPEDCCYKLILRKGGSDNKSRFSTKCYRIRKNSTRVRHRHEFIAVFCPENRNTTKRKDDLVDAFGFVHLKPSVEEKYSNSGYVHKAKTELNVVILGLDGVSDMNFIRTMPKSVKFLNNSLSAIKMNMYGKVGDNTLPSAMAILSGLTETEGEKQCFGADLYFDTCPFIWKNYSQKGFRTIYGEDASKITSFNFEKRGFRNPPTDYYLRTLLNFMYNNLMTNYLCYGPRLGFSILLDYMKKAAYKMRIEEMPYFEFIWSTSLTHDLLNSPGWGDELLLETLSWFQKGNHFTNTIFFLISDHGIRYGPMLNYYQGSVEARMPLLYTIFPKWFSQRYPLAANNFKRNADKLTTPFDVHETLKDLLDLKNLETESIQERSETLQHQRDKFRGISLFLPIPSDRDCVDAGVPENYCFCRPSENIYELGNKNVVEAVNFSISVINDKLKDFPKCAKLKLLSIISARFIKDESHLLEKVDKVPVILMVTFATLPGEARFESTVLRFEEGENWESAGEISRTNLYGNQSSCIHNSKIKTICYCI